MVDTIDYNFLSNRPQFYQQRVTTLNAISMLIGLSQSLITIPIIPKARPYEPGHPHHPKRRPHGQGLSVVHGGITSSLSETSPIEFLILETRHSRISVNHVVDAKMETAIIEITTSRRPSQIGAKRALYQLSYVPLI